MNIRFFPLILTTLLSNHHFVSFSQKIDLNTCLKMADTTSIAIRNARLDLEINKAQRGSYVSARLPQLNFNADYRYNAKIPGQVVPAAFFGGQPGTYSTVQFGVPFVLSNTLQFSQVLFNSQVNYGLEALKINQEIVKVQSEMTIQDIRYQVSNTFFLIQAINKQIEFIDSNILNTKQLLRNMESIVQQGLVIQTESDKIKINELSLQNTKATLLANREQLLSVLKISIGFPMEKELVIETDELVEKTILLNSESKNYFALNLVDWQKKMNSEEKKAIKMGYLPNLSFYAAYNYNVNLKPEDNFRKGIDGAFIGLRLDWNLFDGFDKFYKYKMNALNREKIQNQYDLLQQQLELNAENNRNIIELKSKSLLLTKEQLILAENVYRNANLKFQQGLISSNDLILADNGLQQAQTNVVSAYIQLRQAELEYLKSIGNIK
jgi:outer membrane protein TolC